MRPYLAIILDAFREALGSRILWLLGLFNTLLLIALAPLTFHTELTTAFQLGDLSDPRELVGELERQAERDVPTPGGRIWTRFPAGARRSLHQFAQGSPDPGTFRDGYRLLIQELNSRLAEPDLYDPRAWATVSLDTALRQELESPPAGSNALELQRRNRRLLEATFGERIRTRPAESVVFTYAGWEAVRTPLSEEAVQRGLEAFALPMLFSLVVGTLGVLAAILVTSPMIPTMFDAGSLSLLLSKPASRSLLFLAKFCGGCIFILLNVGYLLAGFWLLVGLRMHVWNAGILLCIPLFVFMFAVYYSVAAVAGVIWKNAVMSVLAAVLLWLLCFVLGVSQSLLDMQSVRITRLVGAGDEVLAINESTVLASWDAGAGKWQPITELSRRGGGIDALGPLYDASQGRIVTAPLQLSFSFIPNRSRLVFANEDEGWQEETGPQMPGNSLALLQEPDGHILAVAAGGIYRLVDQAKSSETDSSRGQDGGPAAQPPREEPPEQVFQRVGPEPNLAVRTPAAAALDPVSGQLVIYTRGSLVVCQPGTGDGAGSYVQVDRFTYSDDQELAVGLAVAQQRLVVARPDGRIDLFDLRQKLSDQSPRQQEPESRGEPRFLVVSPDGSQVAAVFRSGNLWLLDDQQTEFSRPPVAGQGDVSGAAFTGQGTLLVADRAYRVSEYTTSDWKIRRQLAPSMQLRERVYRFLVLPLYRILPKPSELDGMSRYLLTRSAKAEIPGAGERLDAREIEVDIWSPVWSCLAFVVVMLVVACIYLERQDL